MSNMNHTAFAQAGLQELTFDEIELINGAVDWGEVGAGAVGGAVGGAIGGAVGGAVTGGPAGAGVGAVAGAIGGAVGGAVTAIISTWDD